MVVQRTLFILGFFLIGLFFGQAGAASVVYRWVPRAEGSFGAQFRVDYTFGSYMGHSLQGEGQVVFANEKLGSFQKAEFRVPIAALRIHNATMECHLREAVGLDYSHSTYPKDHVCQDDQLPVSGPDGVVYPDVTLKIERIEFRNSSYATLFGSWKIHGQEHPTQFSAEFTRQGRRLLIHAQPTFSLKDFGVQVKNFLFITVSDVIHLDLDIELER